MQTNVILQGDVIEKLKEIPDEFVDCIVTSPPYFGLRDYGADGQIGLEKSLEVYFKKMLLVTAELKRVLKNTGTMWWNHGDSYAGSGKGYGDEKADPKFKSSLRGGGTARSRTLRPEKSDMPAKSLMLQAYRLVIRMIDEQHWILRNTIIWHKKNAMPSSVIDRLSVKYEPVFFFTKSKKYHFDLDSIRVPFETSEKRPDGIVRAREYGYNTKQGTKQRQMEEESRKTGKRRPPQTDYIRNSKGKNPGDVWTLTLQPHPDQHIAMFPEKLITPMIKAGCPRGGGGP